MPGPANRLIAFGEVMLRLSPPGRELLLQSPRLDVWVAGAEANVATQLACLGHHVGFAGRVADNDLGRAALAQLRGRGVDTRHLQLAGERMGLYYVASGAGVRATEVIYDRAYSAFAEAPADAWDWDAILDGADWLHLSGITPALGPAPAAATLAAARAATARGVRISFDGNWRGKLGARGDADPRAILTGIVEHAELLLGNHRDVALLLGRAFAGDDEERADDATAAAFAAFPRLRFIASTHRVVEDADRHRMSVRVDSRTETVRTSAVTLAGIVDRIGAGDAFAAGVLHALLTQAPLAEVASGGLALAALKHSLPGDAGLFREADIAAYLSGGLDVRR